MMVISTLIRASCSGLDRNCLNRWRGDFCCLRNKTVMQIAGYFIGTMTSCCITSLRSL